MNEEPKDPRAGAQRQALVTHQAASEPASRAKARRRAEPGDEPLTAPEDESPPVPPKSIRKTKE